MTQLESAKKNIITPLVRSIAGKESIPASTLSKTIKQGKTVILCNNKHRLKNPCAVGFGLRTKVNANIGTSTDASGLKEELKKLNACVKYGADAVMDLSVGSCLRKIREGIIKHCPIPLGTVPVYEIAVNARKNKRHFLDFGIHDILKTLEEQAKQGVDFFTIHSGVTRKSLAQIKIQPRLMGVVSRGGAILSGWIKRNNKENPFYEYFDRILDIAYAYDVTLSLGDGLRPGSIFDATDKAQIAELRILGELAQRAQSRNVQVMIEGPGHVRLNEIEKNIKLEKKLCHGAPFYVLGPLVTDIAAGYDHISSGIGAAIAASAGADFICYVTPAEHLRLPSLEDVREGVIAAKIAAHAADLVKNYKPAIEWDMNMSRARKKRDWKKQIKYSIDPERAAIFRKSSLPKESRACTMCGKYCSIKIMDESLK